MENKIKDPEDWDWDCNGHCNRCGEYVDFDDNEVTCPKCGAYWKGG